MKWLLLLVLAIILTASPKASADGCFIPPEFVWNKHKDINEPTQKAIIVYDAGQEDLVLQVKYEGPTDEFGWLIPVPNQPNVQQGSMKCFYELSQYTQKHWDGPPYDVPPGHGLDLDSATAAGQSEPPVKVVEIKTVGAYEIAVLSTKDSGALATWLEKNQFYFPTNKTDVLDSYVKQQWYFVAVKIKLDGSGAKLSGTTEKLASGELNPLQISFASDHCVFPLKISSINGKPSEVQLYVVSPEPLLEKAMLEQKLPLIYSNDMAQATRRADLSKEQQKRQAEMMAQFGMEPAPDSRQEENIQKMRETPEVASDELLYYAKVTETDLPDSSNLIPLLANKSWWLTKQTWTFQPEEMRDLLFEPAIPFFSEKLASKYAYFAVAHLANFGSDVAPALIAAVQSTNPAVRVNAVSVLGWQTTPASDPRLTEAAVGWLKDSEPAVREAAANVLTDYPNWKPEYARVLIASLGDDNARVSRAIMFGLSKHREDITNYIPTLETMLQGKNPNARTSALKMLSDFGAPISYETLLSFFSSPDRSVLSLVTGRFRIWYPSVELSGYDISNDEAKPLFQNPEPLARMIGLDILYSNANKQSVEMALSLLNDSDLTVRKRAAATLRALTGQHFTVDQSQQWQEWWTANKTDFVVEHHPEELRPQRVRRAFSGSDAAPPNAVPIRTAQ